MGGNVVEGQPAFALGGGAAAEAEQPGQPAIRGAIGAPDQERRRIDRRELGADQQLDARIAGGDMGADHAGQAVAIGDRQRRVPQLGRPGDQLLRV
jgi:hypothetical protein